MKKIFMMVVALGLLCSVSLLANGSQEEGSAGQENNDKTITLTTGDSVGSLRNLGGWRFKEIIDGHPELNLTVNHIEGAVLGSASQILDQVVEGSVQIFGNSGSWMVPYDKDLQPQSFGFMYRDLDHMQKYFDSPVFLDVVDRIAEKDGLRAVGTMPLASSVYFSNKPLKTVADFDGLKIRAPGLEMYVKTYDAYGANPTTIAWNEIFLALKTGVADAAHGVVSDVIANKWHLAAPYIMNVQDIIASQTWFINEPFWQSLSDVQRKGITEAINETNKWMKEQNDLKADEYIKEMVREGGIIVEFEERELLREKALKAAIELEMSGKWSEGLVDKIQNL